MVKKLFRLLVAISIFCLVSLSSFADLPPDPGSGPTGDPVGGGAPLGGGLIISMTMAALYGTRKIISFYKKK